MNKNIYLCREETNNILVMNTSTNNEKTYLFEGNTLTHEDLQTFKEKVQDRIDYINNLLKLPEKIKSYEKQLKSMLENLNGLYKKLENIENSNNE